ncbi:polysaccharide biosynthesis protein [Clostridium sp. Ade.TY]|uniref:putative polysaccharide biosynthesis protein n=1 Tax=Clostridium sp. Ade.TY TaxID=1391647 RepID=UPI0004110DF1|nr:polysaccharide biosynthesis protein [Clostridium sp. Ade.TY]
MKKQSLIKGSIILGTAGIFARFLGVFFRWPLIMLIGDEGMAFYQMSYPLYMFFVAIASGVPVAISKIVSENNAVGDIEGSFKVVKESTYMMLILGAGTSFFLFFFADFIIKFVEWDPKAYYSIIGISFAPFIISIMTIFRGFFQGLQNMTPSAVSQILEQVGRVIFGVGLAILFLPKGIEFAAGGAAFGAAAGGLFAGGYLYIKYKKVKKQCGIKKVKSDIDVMSKILKIAIPISLGATVGTIMSLIDSIFIPQKLLEAGIMRSEANILYAQLTGKASVIVNIPMTLSMALSISLIPIIAEEFILRRRKNVENKTNLAIKISTVIAIPCMFGMFFMAEPIMKLIFPGRHEGFEILKYLSITIPFIILTQTTTAILQGVGKYILPVINLFIGCLIKLILTIKLVPIPELNIYGAVIASIVAYVVTTALNIGLLKVTLKTRIDTLNNIIKPTIASLIMAIVVLISYKKIIIYTMSNGVSCLISVFLGIIIYMALIVVMKVFDVNEVKSRIYKK